MTPSPNWTEMRCSCRAVSYVWKKRRMAKGDHCQETALKKQSQICIAFEGARIWLDQTTWLVILSGDQLSDSFCFCYLICQSGYLSQTKKYLHKKRKNKKRTNEQTNKRTYEQTANQKNKRANCQTDEFLSITITWLIDDFSCCSFFT